MRVPSKRSEANRPIPPAPVDPRFGLFTGAHHPRQNRCSPVFPDPRDSRRRQNTVGFLPSTDRVVGIGSLNAQSLVLHRHVEVRDLVSRR